MSSPAERIAQAFARGLAESMLAAAALEQKPVVKREPRPRRPKDNPAEQTVPQQTELNLAGEKIDPNAIADGGPYRLDADAAEELRNLEEIFAGRAFVAQAKARGATPAMVEALEKRLNLNRQTDGVQEGFYKPDTTENLVENILR